jgi:hypothetical protein
MADEHRLLIKVRWMQQSLGSASIDAKDENTRFDCPGRRFWHLLIFVAAIWGERIRAWLFKPQLRIELVSPRGVAITDNVTAIVNSQRVEYKRPARYYHVSAINSRRWPIAHDVQILITRLETADAGGMPVTVWTGEIPLQWEHRELHPLLRTVGRPARADLAVVANDTTAGRKELHLLPLIEPTNFSRSYYAATHIWVSVMATANETDSLPLRLEIAWDGEWNAGETEMAQHLVIR